MVSFVFLSNRDCVISRLPVFKHQIHTYETLPGTCFTSWLALVTYPFRSRVLPRVRNVNGRKRVVPRQAWLILLRVLALTVLLRLFPVQSPALAVPLMPFNKLTSRVIPMGTQHIGRCIVPLLLLRAMVTGTDTVTVIITLQTTLLSLSIRRN